MNEQRDAELGARLDELEVREHGPGYWESVMAAAEPELERLRAGKIWDGAGLAQPAGPGPPDGAQAAHSDRRRLFGGRRWLWIPAAGAVAAAAGLVMLFGLPGGGSRGNAPITFGGPQPASAAEAIRFALGALDKAQAIKGTIYIGKVHKGVFEAGDKVAFLSARDGSCRVTTRTVGPDAMYPLPGYIATTAYNARTRQSQAVLDFGSKGMRVENTTPDPATGAAVTTTRVYRYLWAEVHDVPPAPPDAEHYVGLGSTFPIWQVRAYLRTMLGDPRVKLSTGELEGRRVWLLTTRAFTSGTLPKATKGRPVSIAIDARTRLPLRFSGFRGQYEARVDAAALTATPAAWTFRLRKPPARQTHDASDVYASLLPSFPGLPYADAAGMRKAVDGLPAFPRWVPRGFVVQSGASATGGGLIGLPRRADSPQRYVPDTILSLAYRRGFDAAYVTLRPDPRLQNRTTESVPGKSGEVRIDTSDPFIQNVGPWDRAQWRKHTTKVRLRRGTFAGAVAHIVVDPGYWPHLWVRKNGLVAAVAGDLTRAEMVGIAESLAPWNPANGE